MEQVLSVTKSKLDDILDLKLLEEYINQLYKCIQVPITLLDINGEIIFASRWIELCETYIRKDLRLGTTCKEICSKIGEYGPGIFTCPNGLMMYRIPIQVKNGTIAYLVLSQFLMEGTEENYVVDVLRHLNIEESRISAIISEIPILNSKKIQDIIAFMKNLVILLHDMIDRRLKVMELEEEILQSYEELEASYQDVSELNDKLTILNQDLLLKNNIVSQSEKRNQILIDKVKQGIMILNFSIDFSKEIPFYRVRYINKAMRNIINYLSDDIDINSIESELIKYVLINAKHGNLAKEEKRTFHCGENDKYYEIEYEKLSENELMVCILDVTDHKHKIEWQKKQIWDIVSAMGKLVEKRDLYTADHQKKVAILATRIAISLGIERKRIESVFIASLLHDIGKISIPSEILTKPDKLSDIEYELMKTHVLKAYEILKDINFEMPVAEIVKQHHEKINGSGYPDRLAGQEIMLESKIIAVSDVYEAITSHRPYRPSLGVEFAEKHLEAEKGVLYDIEVVEACLKVVESQQWGIDDVYKYLYN